MVGIFFLTDISRDCFIYMRNFFSFLSILQPENLSVPNSLVVMKTRLGVRVQEKEAWATPPHHGKGRIRGFFNAICLDHFSWGKKLVLLNRET